MYSKNGSATVGARIFAITISLTVALAAASAGAETIATINGAKIDQRQVGRDQQGECCRTRALPLEQAGGTLFEIVRRIAISGLAASVIHRS